MLIQHTIDYNVMHADRARARRSRHSHDGKGTRFLWQLTDCNQYRQLYIQSAAPLGKPSYKIRSAATNWDESTAKVGGGHGLYCTVLTRGGVVPRVCADRHDAITDVNDDEDCQRSAVGQTQDCSDGAGCVQSGARDHRFIAVHYATNHGFIKYRCTVQSQLATATRSCTQLVMQRPNRVVRFKNIQVQSHFVREQKNLLVSQARPNHPQRGSLSV